MQRKAHGAQRPRHINSIGEKVSTVQRRDAPEKWIYKGALMLLMIDNYYWHLPAFVAIHNPP